VIYSDYQCHQCKRIENEARALRAKYPDKVSVSHKHYPWCSDCNKYLGGRTLHANACWAARAAETAALLKGNDGFWQMHRWLFDRGGGFTDQELSAGLTQLGYDPKVFIPVMMGEGTLRPVQQDVEEAFALGISGTPMVFINGIELKGWEATRALERTVEAVLNSGAAPATSVNDRPVLAREKYIADWREELVLANVAGMPKRELKNGAGSVEVVVFGDFLEPNTAKIDAMLRDWAGKPVGGGGKPVRYVFRHYPGDKTCNTRLPKTFFENGCLAARAAEAAFAIGGAEAYWKMHGWLMSNQQGFGPEAVRRGAAAVGLDPDALVSAADSAAVQGAIAADIADATRFNVGQIPSIYVNGKFVKRWTREGDNVMERIIDEAAAK
jgi:protein-disulfide isomerase